MMLCLPLRHTTSGPLNSLQPCSHPLTLVCCGVYTLLPGPFRDEAKLRQALALVSSHNSKPLRIDLQ